MKILTKKLNVIVPLIVFLLAAAVPQAALAALTSIWADFGFKKFSKGETENLSLASDGSLSLAPEVLEIKGEKSDAAIISLCSSKSGVVYGGTSFKGRVLIKESKGTSFRVLTETGQLMVSSLCITSDKLYAGTSPNGILFEINPKSGKVIKKHESGENYIWSIIQDSKKKKLLLGTGPEGKVLSFNGRTFKTLTDTKTSHILDLAQHPAGYVIGATSDEALVLNLGRDCKGPVRALFQPPQPECRSIDIHPESGTIYVCATTPPGGKKKQLVSSLAKKSDSAKKGKSSSSNGGKDGNKDKNGDKDKKKDNAKSPLAGKLASSADGTSDTGDHKTSGDSKPDAKNTTTITEDNNESNKDNGKLSTKKEDQIRSFLSRVKKNIASKTADLKNSTGSVTEVKVPFSDGFGKSKQAVYAIDTSGNVRTVLASEDDVFFSVTIFNQKVYCSSGNKGFIYAIDPETLRSRRLVKLDAEQVTTLVATKKSLVAATANEGRIYVIKPTLEKVGSYISDVKKLPFSADFGTITWYLKNGGDKAIHAETRSGFTEKPDETWSLWSKAKNLKNSTRCITNSPAARYFQYKLNFSGQKKDSMKLPAPEVDMVEVCYQPHNLPPHIHSIKVQRPPVSLRSNRNELSAIAMKQALAKKKGLKFYMRAVQWKLSDPNKDVLLSDLFLQLDGDTEWDKLMDEPTEGNAIVWETMSIPDGIYRLKIRVDDSPSNLPQHVKSNERISEPFMIDNTPPQFKKIKVSVKGRNLSIKASIFDESSRIINGEYSLNGDYFLPISPEDGIFDHSTEKINHNLALEEGVKPRTIAIKLFDEFGNHVVKQVFVRNGKGSYKN